VPPVVAVTRRVVEPVRDELTRLFDLRLHDSELPPGRAELLALVSGAEGLVTMLTDGVDAELLDAAGPALRVVANHATGHDNVDLAAARERGVVVTTTPGVLERATAEHTIALLLALTRRVAEGDRFLRRGEPWAWAPTFMLAHGLAGRTLGLVGLGRIGSEVARLGEVLGLEVVYTARTPTDVTYQWLPLGELLSRADVVSLHVPLTDDTRGLIGARELGLMRTDAVLVNTSRGRVVDEAALVDALGAAEIAGAALDVFEHEPAVHPGLLELENVVLTPHLASATHEAREAMGRLCVEALAAVLLEGRMPSTAV
jgi:glyoxylate reductase